jgi:hypothetical protein
MTSSKRKPPTEPRVGTDEFGLYYYFDEEQEIRCYSNKDKTETVLRCRHAGFDGFCEVCMDKVVTARRKWVMS